MIDNGLDTPTRYWAAFAVALGTSLTVIDSTVVNIALPIIAQEYQVSASQSILVVNAYQLIVAMLLLPLAGLGDKLGYRNIFLCGFIAFILASIWCATANNFYSLVFARALQGAGGAGVMCVGTAMLRFIYPPEMLGRGIGINAMVVAGSYASGPSLASLILSIADWPWLFLINIPLGILGVAVAYFAIPINTLSSKRFDIASALLSALTFGTMLLFVESIGHHQNIKIIGILLVTLILVGTIFIRRQLSIKQPLFPVDLLARPLFSLSVLTAVFSFCAQLIVLISLPFFLNSSLGYSSVKIGLLYTAWPVGIMCMAVIAGYLSDKFSAGILGGIGLATAAIGFILLGQLSSSDTSLDVLWRLAMCGIGLGLFQSPNTRFLVSLAPRERIGSVSGLIGTIRLTGQTIGASIAAFMLFLFSEQYGRNSFTLAAIIMVIAMLFSIARTLPRFKTTQLY